MTGVDLTELWQTVVRAGSAMGEAHFYDRLVELLGAVVASDMHAFARYSGVAPPDLIVPQNQRPYTKDLYGSDFFVLHPFHHYWQTCAKPTIRSLRQLAELGTWGNTYSVEFLRVTGLGDQAGMFLPSLGGMGATLILARKKQWFSKSELIRLKNIVPLVEGLHNAHIKAIQSRGAVSGATEKPCRLVDWSGEELFANMAWKKISADAGSGLADTFMVPTPAESAEIMLPAGRRLLRRQLAADSVTGSAGLFDVIDEPPPRSPAQTDSWLGPLTPREREIVMLTLAGHPIAGIAKHLGVGRGTIKNHRVRLYQKLDITTERELFLAHIHNLYAAGIPTAPPQEIRSAAH
jgi:DNA-binding CsgD family transcriptional regulator